MKKNFFSLFKGFSLIELLISLIVISVIAASFAPIFSRKIKDHSLSMGGSQKITNECSSINPDCKICDTTKNICLYCQGTCNVGYKYNTSTCACKRTVCNFNAAKYICENYKTEKTKAGDWRLPLSSELDVLSDIINNQEPSKDGKSGSEKFAAATSTSVVQKYMGAKGLQLCDESSGYGSPMCRNYKNKCPLSQGLPISGHNTTCVPAGLWGIKAGTQTADFLHLSAGKSGGAFCIGTTCYAYLASSMASVVRESYAFSTRCVLEEFLED